MRVVAVIVTVLLVAVGAAGCGRSEPASAGLAESPGEAAARVFARAEELEKGGQARQAYNAYRQVAQNFPSTPEAKKAAARIAQAQKKALRASRQKKR